MLRRCYVRFFERSQYLDKRILTDGLLERIYHDQLALEACIILLTLLAEAQGVAEAGQNAHSALEAIGENAGCT